MEQRKPVSHIVAGLIIAGMMIAISLGLSMAQGTNAQAGAGMFQYLLLGIGICIFVYLYGRSQGYYASFGELFSYGFKASMMVTLVFVLFIFVLSYVMPEMKQKGLEAMRIEMENQDFSDADIDRNVELMQKYFWPIVIGGILLWFLVIGAISSLIGAAITPKKAKNPFDQPNF